MKKIRQHLASYILVLLSVTLSLLLSVLLRPLLKPTIFILFFVAVGVAAWYGGMEAGLLATALSTVAIDYFFVEPLFTLFVYRIDTLVHLSVFLLLTIFLSWLSWELRHAKQRLERKEQQLQLSEKKFRQLLESNIIGVTLSNANGQIVQANDAFLRMLGYSREEILAGQLRWENITVSKYLEISDRSNVELETTGVFEPQEKEYLRKDGSRVPILIASTLVQEPDNIQEEVISFCLDISERKQVEQERERFIARERTARAEAEAANRTKDDFLATLSHELRTPLNAMLGWTQLLKTRKFDEATTAQAIDTIDRNAKSLSKLLEDVLNVSQIIRGKLSLSIYSVEIAPVVLSAIDTVRLAADAKKISIDCKFSSSVGTVMGDANRLQQVIWNLLSNAIKFTPEGGKVTVELEGTNSGVLIRVSDTGNGIDPEFIPHVFERFRQGDNSTTRTHNGLGLGLAIVRHLVELHGGTVCVESSGIGKGATFIVNLPRKVIAVKNTKPARVFKASNSELIDKRSLSLNGLRVLVVDDEPDARQLLTITLSHYGAKIMAVGLTFDALVALQEFHPDILVSDIGMPQEDGYTLIRKIRALSQEEGGQIPAIALTAYAQKKDRKQVLSAGFQIYLSKPVNATKLVSVVANLTKS